MTQDISETEDRIVLSIDIGGSHVKILSSAGGEEQKAESGKSMTASDMVAAVKAMAKDIKYDVISMGYPGPVVHNKPLRDPVNLGDGWVGFDYETAFGHPVRIINDALMQALGSYKGGRMLFLGLGTGLGAAMIVENVAQPMEIAHLPYRKGKSYEHYVSEAYREKKGHKKWQKRVFDVVEALTAALEPDYVVIGGGNVEKLDSLPPKCRRGDNTLAFEGGFRLWKDKELIA
ncbi:MULTISPECIES: ROK family protein [Agrobacterium]|uniref:Polyphosphate glucokinase n=1 Tax=Agrobacterium larrymoorei TaxID=160699 RepID=A0AAJ2EQ14_9HYPH|nr:ROK family protein [Agrobacterium larrymoorei]MDQ1194661.1 polyphosphate glucokinase [Rhizobium sp. SORGH_AS_0787]MDR6100089.1 polyphosphate glucokinase [Agrobacterium larrymoorei]